MSGNPETAGFTQAQLEASKADRRILRTRDKLGDALVALIQQKPFDDITVQEVLDRAGVGRSTFYAHYRDKHDLFLSDVEDFFSFMSTWLTRHHAPAERLAPVTEFFAHIQDVEKFYNAVVASGKNHDIWELGHGYFARSIEERVLLARVRLGPTALRAQAHALAGALISLVRWWLDQGMTTPPEQMDQLFHRMAWAGLGPASGAKPQPSI